MTSIEYEDWVGEHYNNGPELADSSGCVVRLMTCRTCRALIEDNQDCLEAHDRWHNNLASLVKPLPAKQPRGVWVR